MAKQKTDEKQISILIDLPESTVKKIQKDADKELRDRKNHIKKILIDYANKLPA